ncbi:MAG: hypothetical protein ACT4PP_11445 [Sporichthyaceae bacterium]
MKPLSRTQRIAAGVTAAVILVGGVSVFAFGGGDDGPAKSKKSRPAAEAAAEVAAALSRLAQDPESLVATDVRSAIGTQARAGVPAGTTVTPNPATWQPDGLGGGTMTVTLSGGGQPTVVYSAVMIEEEDGWKVVGTIPLIPSDAGEAPGAPGKAPAANAPDVAAPGKKAPVAGTGTAPVTPPPLAPQEQASATPTGVPAPNPAGAPPPPPPPPPEPQPPAPAQPAPQQEVSR